MKKHINIGMMGHINHGKTTLTAAITSTLASIPSSSFKDEPEKGITIPPIPDQEYQPAPKRRSSLMGLMAMTALVAGSFGGYGGHSSYAERHDPNRPKTPEDLDRMEAAQRKRDRKAARQSKGTDNQRGEEQ